MRRRTKHMEARHANFHVSPHPLTNMFHHAMYMPRQKTSCASSLPTVRGTRVRFREKRSTVDSTIPARDGIQRDACAVLHFLARATPWEPKDYVLRTSRETRRKRQRERQKPRPQLLVDRDVHKGSSFSPERRGRERREIRGSPRARSPSTCGGGGRRNQRR